MRAFIITSLALLTKLVCITNVRLDFYSDSAYPNKNAA